MDFMAAVGDLVDRVGRAWERQACRGEAFVEIAYDALQTSGLRAAWDMGQLHAWLREGREVPTQFDPLDHFGEPPVTLRWHPSGRFFVDVYFWTKADLQMHDHGFSGACLLLQGESLNCEYDFRTDLEVTADVALGEIALKRAQRLTPGDCFAIYAGRALRHRVWHVARPTVSLVLRTVQDPRFERQLAYLEPGLALNCYPKSHPTSAKQYALCRMLRGAGDSRWRAVARDLIETSDLHAAFWTIITLNDDAPDEELVEKGVGLLERRHGRPLALVAEAIRGRAERALLLPPSLTDQDDRFLIATMLTLGLAPAGLQMLASRRPDGGGQAAWVRRVELIGARLGEDASAVLTRAVRGSAAKLWSEDGAS